MDKHLPLLACVLVPLSLLFAMQAVSLSNLTVAVFAFAAATVSAIALVVRMLEIKIKAAARTIIAASVAQSILSIFSIISATNIPEKNSSSFVAVLNALSLISSLASASILFFLTTQHQPYAYTLYALSPSQRQLAILLSASLLFIVLSSATYARIEQWLLADALYWSISTFATIGFGDFCPKTTAGKSLLPPLTIIGIALTGSLVWSLRNVFLEMLTVNLASKYSAFLAAEPLLSRRHSDSIQYQNEQSESAPLIANQQTHAYDAETDASHSTHPFRHNNRSTEFFIPSSGMLATYDPSHINQPASDLQNNSHQQIPVSPLLNLAIDASSGMDLSNLRLAVPTPTKIPITSSPIQISPTDPFQPLPLSRHHTTTTMEISNQRQRQPRYQQQQTLTVTRSQYLPQLTIITDPRVDSPQALLHHLTHRVLISQIIYSMILISIIILSFSFIFSYLESWSIPHSIYFCYISMTTIGYGDITVSTSTGKSVFVWFVIVALCGWTYLGSMIGEIVLSEWRVTVGSIEKRVGRYERKAQLKKMYGNSMRNRGRNRKRRPVTVHGDILSHHEDLHENNLGDQYQQQQPGPSSSSQEQPATNTNPINVVVSSPLNATHHNHDTGFVSDTDSDDSDKHCDAQFMPHSLPIHYHDRHDTHRELHRPVVRIDPPPITTQGHRHGHGIQRRMTIHHDRGSSRYGVSWSDGYTNQHAHDSASARRSSMDTAVSQSRHITISTHGHDQPHNDDDDDMYPSVLHD